MSSLSKCRPKLARVGMVLAMLTACGLLAGCTQAPKLAKVPDRTEVGEAAPQTSAPPPSAQGEANAPAQPAPEATPSETVQSKDIAGSDGGETNKHSRHYKSSSRDREYPADADQFHQEQSSEIAGGAAPGSDETPQAPASSAPSTGAPTAKDPVGGGTPPGEIASPAPPPPPPSPAPAAQPPAPPAAPGAAARAGAEAEAGAAAIRRAEDQLREEKAARETAEAKAAAPAKPAPDPAKTYDVVPVFYGTDRAVEPDPNRLQFGEERGHKLQLGRAMITVPLIHKVPHIERPVVVEIPYFKVKVYEEKEDPEKHFTIQEIRSLTEDEMLALVRQRLATSSTFKDHAFVFVHGFNTSFDNALYRTAQIAYDLHFDGAPFLYSWPSGGKIASYTYDHGSVEQAEPTLTEFLKMVIQKSGAKSISLIAHSMGNELLLRVLQQLKPHVPPGVVISQVILAAPDVDRDKFNIIAREITNFAKGVTLYAASNDRALSYSARFWGGVPRAGDIPASGPLIIPGVDTIDVTAVSTDALGLNHSGYAENPALLSDVKALVEYGIRPPDKRVKGILTVKSDAGTYWRFEVAK